MNNLKKNLIEIGRGLFTCLTVLIATGIIVFAVLVVGDHQFFPGTIIPSGVFVYCLPGTMMMMSIEIRYEIIFKPIKSQRTPYN